MVIKYNLQHQKSKELAILIVSLQELYDGKAKFELERQFDLSWSVVSECRSIGIVDKNKKSIFENDVVKCTFINDMPSSTLTMTFGFSTITGVVKYHQKFCMFYIAYNEGALFFKNNYIIEIIGNIHTHTELLNVSQHEA